MTTLSVSSTTDYSTTNVGGTTDLLFKNIFGPATATFSSVQVGPQLSSTLAVKGNIGINNIAINITGLSCDISHWTFATWGANDTITLTVTGAGASHVIKGSVRADLILGGNASSDQMVGGLGSDTLVGGLGNDIFFYSVADGTGTETVDGGGGTDKIQLSEIGQYGFDLFTITSVEELVFAAGTASSFSTVKLLSSFFAGGSFQTITGNTGNDRVQVQGVGIDLTGTTFNAWTAGTDTVQLIATAAGAVKGSAQADEMIDNGQGALAMQGNDGNDVFHYIGNGASALGDAISGGLGDDTILLETFNAAATVSLFQATVSGVEKLVFADGTSITCVTDDTQIASGFTTIDGAAASTLVVQILASNGNFDGAAYTFVDWSGPGDLLKVIGNNDFNRITGSANGDSILGNGLDDIIKGGAGADTLDGGADIDTLLYTGSAAVTVDLGNGTATGGDATGDLISNFENVTGGGGADKLIGSGQENTLKGGGGADNLTGGGSKDILTGNTGADRFIYLATTDSAFGTPRDLITDFVQGSDKIDLSAIDAVAGGTDDLFIFHGTGSLGFGAGLRYTNTATQTVIFADANSDGTADLSVVLTGVFTLQASDFVL